MKQTRKFDFIIFNIFEKIEKFLNAVSKTMCVKYGIFKIDISIESMP